MLQDLAFVPPTGVNNTAANTRQDPSFLSPSSSRNPSVLTQQGTARSLPIRQTEPTQSSKLGASSWKRRSVVLNSILHYPWTGSQRPSLQPSPPPSNELLPAVRPHPSSKRLSWLPNISTSDQSSSLSRSMSTAYASTSSTFTTPSRSYSMSGTLPWTVCDQPLTTQPCGRSFQSEDGTSYCHYFQAKSPVHDQSRRPIPSQAYAHNQASVQAHRRHPRPTLMLLSSVNAVPTTNRATPLDDRPEHSPIVDHNPSQPSAGTGSLPYGPARSSFAVSDILPSDPPSLSPNGHEDSISYAESTSRSRDVSDQPPSSIPHAALWQGSSPVDTPQKFSQLDALDTPTSVLRLHSSSGEANNDDRQSLPSFPSVDAPPASSSHVSLTPTKSPRWGVAAPSPGPVLVPVLSLRKSVTLSEAASSRPASDNETQLFSSGDEDEFDHTSDSAYDSLRTGMTKNSGYFTRPTLETLFNAPRDEQKTTNGSDKKLLHPRQRLNRPGDESMSLQTWATTGNGRNDISMPSQPVACAANDPSETFSSSSPDTEVTSEGTMTHISQPLLGETLRSAEGAEAFRREEIAIEDWDEDQPASVPLSHEQRTPTRTARVSSGARRIDTVASGKGDLHDSRPSLFDWAENQVSEQSADDGSPRGPRTAHGKVDVEVRGGRSSGRLEEIQNPIRSQSVPLAPDTKKRSIVTSKFGTWGVGTSTLR